MWRLQIAQQHHCSGQISDSPHSRFHCHSGWENCFLKGKPSPGLPPSYRMLILRDLTFLFSVTCLLGSHDHVSQLHSTKSFSTCGTPFNTQAFDELLLAHFIWHVFIKDVRNWVHSCIGCQQSKIHRHMVGPLHNFVVPDNQFDHQHIDIIIGPLPSSRGQAYLFTIIVRFIRWPEAIPMLDATKETCARGLLSGWISQFGLSTIITSDHGPQFVSSLWCAQLDVLHIEPRQTTSYHPQANGKVENLHCQIKASLKAKLSNSDWVNYSQWYYWAFGQP